MAIACWPTEQTYLSLEHLELAAVPCDAEELAAVPRGHTRILGDPLFHVTVEIQVVWAVVFLTLLFSETLS